MSPFPTIDTWLAKSEPTHHLRRALHGAAVEDPVFAALEELLRTLDRAAPNRLKRKKRDFAKDGTRAGVLNLRAELLPAYRLARAGVPFQFGAEGRPDLELLDDGPLAGWAIEIGTRDRDDVERLEDEATAALTGARAPSGQFVNVRIVLDTRPLTLAATTRRAVVEQLVAWIETGRFVHRALTLREIVGFARAELGEIAHTVTVETGSQLSRHFEEVEREVRNKLQEKRPSEQRRLAAVHAALPRRRPPGLGVASVYEHVDLGVGACTLRTPASAIRRRASDDHLA